MLRSDSALPAATEGWSEQEAIEHYKGVEVIGAVQRRRRLTKTVLWQLYFQLNWLKAWVFLIRCAVSTGKFEFGF